MSVPLVIRMECAKGEIQNAINAIQKENELPLYIMDGLVASVLAEIRNGVKIELINATNKMMKEKNEELEKAKKEAKRILKEDEENILEEIPDKEQECLKE